MEIADPQFEIGNTVRPAPGSVVPVNQTSRVGRVESRAWTEWRGEPGYWRYTVRWPKGGTSSGSDKNLQPAPEIACDVKVVVNAIPVPLTATTTMTAGELIARAFREANVPVVEDADLAKRELRTLDGTRISQLVGDADLDKDGNVFVISPASTDMPEKVDGEFLATNLEPDPEARRPNPHLPQDMGQVGHIGYEGVTVWGPKKVVEDWESYQSPRYGLIREVATAFLRNVRPSLGGVEGLSMALAGTIEKALLNASFHHDEDRQTTKPSPVHLTFDRVSIPRSAGNPARSLTLMERAVMLVERYAALAADKEKLESARAGEDRYKAERDSALHLVRWLIGDIIPPDLIRLGDDEEN